MVQKSAHNSIWKTTDAMIIITLVVGFVLNVFVLNLGSIPFPPLFRIFLGGFFILAGLSIILLAKNAFNKKKQPSGPGKPTTKIVDNGIFKYSRNPLYLGIVITLIGGGIAFDNLWFIVLAIPLSVLIHFALIIPEEQYLLDIFGKDYEVYLKNVKRWL